MPRKCSNQHRTPGREEPAAEHAGRGAGEGRGGGAPGRGLRTERQTHSGHAHTPLWAHTRTCTHSPCPPWALACPLSQRPGAPWAVALTPGVWALP